MFRAGAATASLALTLSLMAPGLPMFDSQPPMAVSAGFATANADSIKVLVNKKHPLPQGYAPQDLKTVGGVTMRSEAAKQLQKMLDAARANGTPLIPRSGYRSYATQKSVYNKWVGVYGKEKAGYLSAKPGYSEHQTGLAIDIAPATGNCQALSSCMASTPAGKWLAKHAADYGFILRYEKGHTDITGYYYEPWHYRYLGVKTAKDYQAGGFHTYEEYLKATT